MRPMEAKAAVQADDRLKRSQAAGLRTREDRAARLEKQSRLFQSSPLGRCIFAEQSRS